jgi:hypothetical protein
MFQNHKKALFLNKILRVCFAVYILMFPMVVRSQVSLNTGSAVQSIPIFNFNDNASRLNLPLSIVYNSGMGLKVDEVASDIGQGWGLIAGGKITRIQVGEPDDQKKRNGIVSDYRDITKYPAGYYYGTQTPANGTPKNYAAYPVFPNQNSLYKAHNDFTEDRELDYFIIAINGTSATFVIPRGSENGVFLGQTLMKIKVFKTAVAAESQPLPTGYTGLGAARTHFTAFELTDENGLIYRFEHKGYQKLQKAAPSDRNFVNKQNVPKKYRNKQIYHSTYFDDPNIVNPWVVNEWHLTSIKDGLLNNMNSRPILFYYTYKDITTWQGVDFSIVKSKREYAMLNGKKGRNLVPVLDSISCPNNYVVQFKYGAERFDLPGTNVLSNIAVTYNGRFVQRHDFEQTYVIFSRYGTPKDEIQKKASRLYLASITKRTADLKDTELPTRFDYYLGGSNSNDFVPPPFYFAKDIWGYFNGFDALGTRTSNQKLWDRLFNRKATEFPDYEATKKICFKDDQSFPVKPGYAKNGLLKSIAYPQGGRLEYEYDQNKAIFWQTAGAQRDVGGVHVSRTKVYDGDYYTKCDGVGPMITNYNYILENGNSSLWGMESPDNRHAVESVYRPFEKYVKLKGSIIPVKCDYRFKYPGIPQVEYAAKISGYQDLVTSPGFEAASNILGAINTVSTLSTLSSATSFTIVMFAVAIVIDLFDAVFSCFVQDDIKYSTVEYWYGHDMNAGNPLPVQYKRVEVVQQNGQAGKVINEYTSHEDYNIWIPVNPQFNKRQRFAPWVYGLLKRTVVLNKDSRLVKETINEYRFNDRCCISNCDGFKGSPVFSSDCGITKTKLNLLSCNTQITKSYPVKSSDWLSTAFKDVLSLTAFTTTGNSTNGLNITIYDLYTGRSQLASTTEKVYDQVNTAKVLVKKTRYTYNPINYLPACVEEISTSGTSTVAITKYQTELAGGATPNAIALNKLINANIRTTPVMSKTLVRTSGMTHYDDGTYYDLYYDNDNIFINRGFLYLTLETTDFVSLSNGLVKPATVWAKRANQPVSYFSTEPNIPVQQLHYDQSTGVVLGMTDEGNRNISRVYDYQKQFVTASVINANALSTSADKVAYTSFETESSSGGWTITGTRRAGTSITGYNYFAMNTGQRLETTDNIPVTNFMILSFWASNSTFTISGISSQTNRLAAFNTQRFGYTYYEYRVKSSGGKISITGIANMDELRLYPEKARMTTTTYDPLYGKIAECDQNNRITYYEYDSKGRMRAIKDDEGAIIKLYEYNEKGSYQKCGPTYESSAAWELVQKNNCPAGSIGNYYEVYVAKGTFTSTISQQHADALLEQYLDANAQNIGNLLAGCRQVFSNVQKSITLQKDDCNEGQLGSFVTYTVPAGKYKSTESQQDANEQAEEDMDANAQQYANALGICNFDNTPTWVAEDDAQMRCQTSNGQNTGITEVQMRNVNPNSSTYNQLQWFAMEENVFGCVPPVNGTQLIYEGPSSPQFIINFLDAGTGQNYSFSTNGPIGIFGELGPLPPGLYKVSFYTIGGSFPYQYELDTFESPGGLWSGSGYGYTEINGIYISGNNSIVKFKIY